MQKVRKTAPEAERIALRILKEAKSARLIAKIGTAVEEGDITEKELEPFLEIVAAQSLKRQRDTDLAAIADLAVAKAAPNQTNYNRLSEFNDTLNAVDSEIRTRILGSSIWLDPLPTERCISLLTDKGYHGRSISSSLEQLKSIGAVQLTSSHILPKDLELCQEAADVIADEFIDLLGTL